MKGTKRFGAPDSNPITGDLAVSFNFFSLSRTVFFFLAYQALMLAMHAKKLYTNMCTKVLMYVLDFNAYVIEENISSFLIGCLDFEWYNFELSY